MTDPKPLSATELAELRKWSGSYSRWEVVRLFATIDAYEKLWECNGPRDCTGTERGCSTCGPSVAMFLELVEQGASLKDTIDAQVETIRELNARAGLLLIENAEQAATIRELTEAHSHAGSCDWGNCDDPVYGCRYSPSLGTFLGVCFRHSSTPDLHVLEANNGRTPV